MSVKLYTITESRLKAIADAIREAEGSTGAISTDDFATRIKALTSGSTTPTDPTPSDPVEETSTASITYQFDNSSLLNANGVVVISCDSETDNGLYDLMWGDADGIMENYSAINSSPISLTAGSASTWDKFCAINGIPKYATRICAVKDGVIKASLDIDASKKFNETVFGTHRYSVEVLSDVHYQYESGSEDWQRAFEFGRDRESISAICIAGDFCDAGQQSHLNVWKSARDSVRGTTPVYGCNGNHEEYGSNNLMVTDRTALRPYMDSDFTSANGDPWFTKTIGGDLYVFVPIFEGVVASASAVMFSDDCLTWLEGVLEEHRNERVFLFAHVPPSAKYTGTGGFGIGNYAYSLDLWGGKNGSDALADRIAFLDLMEHYKNVIWFSGHSHIKYQYQEIYPDLNYYRYKDGARLIHVSSLTVPRDVVSGTVSDYIYAESEGYVMDVYDNHIILRGRNFVDDKYLGGGTFVLDTTPVTIAAKPVEETPVVTLTSISATKTTTTYNVGDAVATDDVTVTATYSDGSTATVTGATYSTVDTSSAGTKTLTVTYEGKTTTISIVVNAVVVPDPTPSDPTVPSLITTKGTGQYLQMYVTDDPTHYFTLYFVDSAAVISHTVNAGYDVWTSTKQCKYYVFESTDSGQTWQNNSGDSGHTIYTSGNVKPTSNCYFGGDYKSDAITLLNEGVFTAV